MTTRMCVVSSKECWQDEDQRWFSDGGFPLQVQAIATFCDELTMVVTRRRTPAPGGTELPPFARIATMLRPDSIDLRRKMFVLRRVGLYWRTIARHVREADVIYIPLPGDLGLIALFVAWWHRRRILVRYCGSWETNDETTVMNRVTKRLIQWVARSGAAAFATGTGEAAPAPGVRWIFASAVTRAELQSIHPVFNRGLSDPPAAVCIGRLSEEKGLDVLFRALDHLRRAGCVKLPHVTFIGDGPDRKALEALARELGCDSLVRFTGQLDRRALGAELLRADFCIHPSKTEGYSKAVLDAFAFGLPVLATDVGSARSMIGTTRGWLVPAGDPAGLARGLQSVLTTDQDWPKRRRACREYVESRTLEDWRDQLRASCEAAWRTKLKGVVSGD